MESHTHNDLASQKLAQSGFTLEEAKLLGITALSAAQTQNLSSQFKPLPSLRIDYYDLQNNKIDFYRLRYLTPPLSIAAQTEKPQRYTQPFGTSTHAYFPNNVNWQLLSTTASQFVVITEGELKSLCASKHGIPTIGLGGVWSFMSKKKGWDLLPELKLINWRDRKVYLIFDSDLWSNHNVTAALNKLMQELTTKGAELFVPILPSLPELKKTGLDDYIIDKGPESLIDLINETAPANLMTELFDLNSEVTYVKEMGMVAILEDKRLISPQSFTGHAYANRFIIERKQTVAGELKLTKRSAADEWIKWPLRSEVKTIVYEPGLPTITNKNELNTWTGWGCEPVEGIVEPFLELLTHLFRGFNQEREWFMKWLALPLQKPSFKMSNAVLIWGVKQGTGKSLIGETMVRIYGKNGIEVSKENLLNAYNDWSVNKQFVFGDEILGKDQRNEADRLKSMVTRETIQVNKKYIPSYEIRDYINYYFTSNHPDAFFMEDKDRRFFIHEVIEEPLSPIFYKEYRDWKNGDGPSYLFDYLLKLDLKDFDGKAAAPRTAAKEEMTLLVKSDLSYWVSLIMQNENEQLPTKMGDIFTAEEILQLYDPSGVTRVSLNGLGRELKRSGAIMRPVKVGPITKRLIVIRNIKEWQAKAPQLWTEHYQTKIKLF